MTTTSSEYGQVTNGLASSPVVETRASTPASLEARPFACRSCGSSDVLVFLPLGSSPLANALITPGQEGEEKQFPLDVGFCRGCSLVQLTFAPAPDELFRDYPYFSSFSDTMVEHARLLSQGLIQDRGLGSRSLVVELASNDGYLLQFYKEAGIPVLGIEPAENIAEVARSQGIETLAEFFGSEVGERLAAEGRGADVVHAHNVLAHVPDLNGFVAGIQRLLKPDGIAVIEAPYVRDLIENVEFDTIYHEHLSYFSLSALDRLFTRHGLTIFDVKRVPIHGGSLQLHIGHADSVVRKPGALAILAAEKALGMDDERYYRSFGDRVERLRIDLLALLSRLKSEGKRIAGYGASAKGTTLLTFCGIGSQYLDFLVDRSTVKQGHLSPGSHLPIYAPHHLLADQPDYALLLVWNFAEEVMAQQAKFRSRGGRFIIPIPEPRIV